MKDLIAFCMEKHEIEVRALSKTPLGGERFTQFIARYEMNTEPLPAADANPEKYVILRFLDSVHARLTLIG